MNNFEKYLLKGLLALGVLAMVAWMALVTYIFALVLGDAMYLIVGMALAFIGTAATMQPPFVHHIGPERVSSREVLAALRRAKP